jgi:hypothetical protein
LTGSDYFHGTGRAKAGAEACESLLHSGEAVTVSADVGEKNPPPGGLGVRFEERAGVGIGEVPVTAKDALLGAPRAAVVVF